MTEESISIGRCIHCGKYAVTDKPPLCVEHWLMYEQALHLKLTWLATYKNYTSSELEATTGFPVPRIEIPQTPFIGKNYNLSYINIGKGHIEIDAQTIQNIDITIGILKDQGNNELADEIKRLTEAVNASQELTIELKDEVAEQLAYVAAQVGLKDENRSKGITKSLMHGLYSTLGTSAALLTIWNNLEPLLKAAFGS
jgi:hypothetical protein